MPPTTTRRPDTRAKARHSREESRAKIVAAATELVRERSYAELSVGEIMDRAGMGRTLFYRHFDDLDELLSRAGLEAAQGMFSAAELIGADGAEGEDAIRPAMVAAAAVYRRHGPVLRAIAEAGASNHQFASGRTEIRDRMNEVVAHRLRRMPEVMDNPPADLDETARALTQMMTAYMLDAYGYSPRISDETAVQTITEIWLGVINRGGNRVGS